MSIILLCLFLAPSQDPSQNEARARQVARSVDLFTLYTGEPPRSLEELVHQPDRLRFWPEGGFWVGPLPDGVTWKEGRVHIGAQSVEAAPPSWNAIVPSSDRLRAHYSGRVRLQLARAAVEAHLKVHRTLPSAAELGALALDPWGKPLAVEPGKGRLRLALQDAAVRALSLENLTPDEAAALEKAAPVAPPEGEVKATRDQLDRLADDDYETRLEAVEQLRRRGALVTPELQKRLKTVKDPDVLRRLSKIEPDFVPVPPSWKTELRPLSTLLLAQRNPAADASCANNLSQLWKMEFVYMSQFGGRMKAMPKETGKEFWLALSKTQPPLIDETLFEIYICPASGLEPKAGVCSYAGPAQGVARAADNDPVGLCDDEGHGDEVILLRKSGDVMMVPREGPEHQAAPKATKR
jgi:hypothetical protein